MENELLNDVCGFINDDIRDHVQAVCGLLEFVVGNNTFKSCEGSEDVLIALGVYLREYNSLSIKFIDEVLEIIKRTDNGHSAWSANK